MIRYQKDTDNIATLTLDMQGRNVNIINHEISAAFSPVLEHLKKEKARRALRGVIITSAKRSFLAGGDLEYLHGATDPKALFEFSEKLKGVFRDLERPGVPVVAAINGTALGTGFELALACHHRIAVDDPHIRLGHPETTLGLMPGSGGVIRLLWLLGLERAFPVLEGGQSYAPAEALQVGLVDELAVNERAMIDQAKEWLLQMPEGRRPWDTASGAIPGGTANSAAVAQVVSRLAAGIARKYRNNYPAPQAILSTLAEGSKVNFDTACRLESRQYARLLAGQVSKNMIQAFWFDQKDIRAGISRPKGFGKFRPRKVGVIGAGLMGSGIAVSCLLTGLEVVLKDVSKPIAEKGRDYVRRRLELLQAEGRLSAAEAEQMLGRIATTETPRDFAACDLVIEAVFENAEVKAKVTREAEAFLDEYSLFASNTTSIPITRLGEASLRPENYVGLHFFHPVEGIPLVEVVRGNKTSDETVARAFDFVKAIRKTPIVVKDAWGFYAARVRNTYILEGITLLQEGYPPALIENLGMQAGMPVGALQLADDLSLKLVRKYESQAAELYGPRYIQHPAVEVLEKMLGELDRPGGKSRRGFYEAEENEERSLWSGLTEHFPVARRIPDARELPERFLFAQVLEAIWCLQEKVIGSVPEANLGSIYGWGFPGFKGGVVQYIADYGLQPFLKRCKELEKKHGPRFKAPGLLTKDPGRLLAASDGIKAK